MRNMASDIIASLPPYQNKWEVVKKYQETPDIISLVISKHSHYAPHYDKISERFWKGSAEKTAQYLFDFCKDHIKYKIEPVSKQTVKSPAALLSMGYGDCKHYASFINGIIDSLRRKGYPVSCIYRFASYRLFERQPGHVFAVMPVGSKEIWIDPVLEDYDDHKSYYHHIDKKFPMLFSVSGIEEDYQGYGLGRRKAGGKKPKFLLKIGMAPSRNAFLLLVELNTFHLATKMHQAMQKNPAAAAKIQKAWTNLGGDWNKLKKNIQKGVNTYNKLHKKRQIHGFPDEHWYGIAPMGAIGNPAAVVAVIAAAAPIIAKLGGLLKSLGINTKKVDDSTQEAGAAIQDAVQEQQEKGTTTKVEQMADAMNEAGLAVSKSSVRTKFGGDGSDTLEMTGPQPADNTPATGRGAAAPSANVSDMFDEVKSWLADHKKPIMWGVAGVAGLIIVPKIFSAMRGSGPAPKRRR